MFNKTKFCPVTAMNSWKTKLPDVKIEIMKKKVDPAMHLLQRIHLHLLKARPVVSSGQLSARIKISRCKNASFQVSASASHWPSRPAGLVLIGRCSCPASNFGHFYSLLPYILLLLLLLLVPLLLLLLLRLLIPLGDWTPNSLLLTSFPLVLSIFHKYTF